MIVSLTGDARAMPWNSSKSDISPNHPVFREIQDWRSRCPEILRVRCHATWRWLGEWPEKVFKYKSGAFVNVEIPDFTSVRKAYLPPLPRVRPRFGDVVAAKNAAVVRKKPWTRGLYEGVIAAHMIAKQKYAQKNRIALIVLDSTLEIAFKEFLVNDSGTFYSDKALRSVFEKRHLVHAEIKKYVGPSTTTYGRKLTTTTGSIQSLDFTNEPTSA